MKYKIFLKNNEVTERETLDQCINCIAAMLNALGNDYARSDFKIYAKVDSGLDRIESLENLIDAYKLDTETGKDIINELKAENEDLKINFELLNNHNDKTENENEELKKENFNLRQKLNTEENCAVMLESHNKKLKAALTHIKNILNIKILHNLNGKAGLCLDGFNGPLGILCFDITEEQSQLLIEVLDAKN